MLGLLFGIIVGFSLGLTGGGGALFAVPLLVYGLGLELREAVGVSLVAVGTTAFLGFLQRLRLGLVEVRTGLLFAVAGMTGAPAGAWLAGRIPEPLLLAAFAGLMLLIAYRMWRQSGTAAESAAPPEREDEPGPACRRDPEGNLRLNSRCALLLALVGLGTGLLSGLFGVGGGFIIVPALVAFSGLGLQRAIGTSLLVMALVSVSGVAGHMAAHRSIPVLIAALFAAGGALGMVFGTWLGGKIAGPRLQQVFSVAIVGVALFVIVRSLV